MVYGWFAVILGDPGAASLVMRKSRRSSLQERKRSPWDSTLNRPVPKPIEILVCDWAQKYFCAQSQTRISIGFGTGRLRVESQGLLFRSCKLDRLDFLMTQLAAPGSPRMVCSVPQSKIKIVTIQ